jgi:N-methylhydantoinase A
VRERFRAFVDGKCALVDGLAPPAVRSSAAALQARSRRTMAYALGLSATDPDRVLGLYDAIVAAVTEITAGRAAPASGREAYALLCSALEPSLDADPEASLLAAAANQAGGLPRDAVLSNAAVLLFGGIETTEGMIANAVAHLLAAPGAAERARAAPGALASAIEESLRLEPAAAVVDRYATRDVALGGRGSGASSSSSHWREQTAIRRCSRIPTDSTSGVRALRGSSRSRRAHMSASGFISRGWRRAWRSAGRSSAGPCCGSTLPTAPRPAASSSASRRPSTSAGTERRGLPRQSARCAAPVDVICYHTMHETQAGYRLGIDIGGTFTDVVLLGGDGTMRTRKVLSTPDDYARGVIEGALGLLDEAGVAPGEVTGIVHATTVASNTVLEGQGARTALITTAGFRDVLEMRRLRIPVMYDLQYDKPAPLVPRRRRYEVTERMGREAMLARARREIRAHRRRGGARRRGRRARDHAAALYANAGTSTGSPSSCSRSSATTSRHLLRRHPPRDPRVRAHQHRRRQRLRGAAVAPTPLPHGQAGGERVTAPLQIMQSAGGTMRPAAALRRGVPRRSGPAAGVIACAHLARATGRTNVISFDMGGARPPRQRCSGTASPCGRPSTDRRRQTSQQARQGGGYAIKLPSSTSRRSAPAAAPSSPSTSSAARCRPRSAVRRQARSVTRVEGAADARRRPRRSRLPQPRPARRRRRHARRPRRPRRVARHGRRSPRPAGARGRVRRAHGRRRHHDPRRQSRLHLPGTRPARLRAVRFRGQRPARRRRIARALGMRRVLVRRPRRLPATWVLFSQTEQGSSAPCCVRTARAGDGRRYAASRKNASLADRNRLETVTLARLADLRYAGQAYELTVRVPDGPSAPPTATASSPST